MWCVIVMGAIVCAFVLMRIDFRLIESTFLLFAVVTLGFASRIVVQIPKVKGRISVSDTFIFLAILVFGGNYGILLAGADAGISSIRVTKSKFKLVFNISVYLVSTWLAVTSVSWLVAPPETLAKGVITSEFLIAICLMALVQYVFNSGLVAIAVALSTEKPLWKMWRENFLWTSITYFAGASAAGMIAQLIGAFGVFALLAAVPIVAVVYFTYTTYLQNVEQASEKADLAQRHVEELSHHIAEQERISEALKEREEYFRTAFDNAAGMALTSPDGRWLEVNDSLCEMLGYSESELVNRVFHDITHPDDLGNDLANLYKLLEGSIQNYQLEKRFFHKSGDVVWVLQSASIIRDPHNEPKQVVFQIQNINDRKRAEEQIRWAAFHDSLTKLPNRTLFVDRLSMAVERSKRNSSYQFAVIFADLDRFKIVNDSLGHDMGDSLLEDLATRFRECVRSTDTVARFGGDEFAILIESFSSTTEVEVILDRIQSSLQRPFHLVGHEFTTTASIGVAYSSLGYTRPEDIIRDADTAMYRAKSNGKARYEVFDSGMHMHAFEFLTIENELRKALEHGEIVPHFQPIISLSSRKIIGFEALARWNHPKRGMIAPAEFIPIAEENGLIVPIGLSMIQQACDELNKWQVEFPHAENLSVSVNISGTQFRQTNLVEEVNRILTESKVQPNNLRLELTESTLMRDTASAAEMLTQLKSLGLQLSIDDFGTGYSSLSYLHRFPFDSIKIDQSFVSRMNHDRESWGIVKTIIMLANELGKTTIAEGVERDEQLAMLTSLSCQFGQGYYFSKPLTAADVVTMLKNKNSADDHLQPFMEGKFIRRESIADEFSM